MEKLLFLLPITLLLLLLLPALTDADCSCDIDQEDDKRSRAISLKLAAIFSILAAGFIGVYIPSLGKWLPAISPEKNIFFVIKAFAAGVILSTGFIHILPDAFENLTSPCLNPSPWQDFPFAGFFAMVAAMGTLVIDTVATGYYNRIHNGKVIIEKLGGADEEGGDGQLNLHSHAKHGHAHGMGTSVPDEGEDLIRRRVISQVLEVGIVVHSVIIGLSLGASDDPSTIRPLVVALSFHQFFEGMGLGGCLVQVHERQDTGEVDVLTKGDNNFGDDRLLYAHGQLWLQQHHIMGRAVGFLPYVGWVTIIMTEKPIIKYLLIGALGLLVITSKE